MADIADLIALHAATAVFAVAAFMMIVTAGLWRLIDRVGARWLNRAAAYCSASAQHPLARRLQTLPWVGPAADRMARHTASAARYLGTHAVLSFLTAMVALATLVEIADEIGVDEPLAQFDRALSSALSRHLSHTVLQACAIVTHLGDGVVLFVLAACVAMVLWMRREALLAWVWLAATASGGLLNYLLKLWFARLRPVRDHSLVTVDGWSFPSGHACGSMLVYGLLGYLLVRHTRAAMHIPIVAATVVVVVCVGASRVLLQVHYLSDVLAGWATATLWMSLCIAGLEAVRRRMLLAQEEVARAA